MEVQAAARQATGPHLTLFRRLVVQADAGPLVVTAGDIVGLNVKPAQYGRVLHFSIDQVPTALHCPTKYVFWQLC